jgi:hypothetical protein
MLERPSPNPGLSRPSGMARLAAGRVHLDRLRGWVDPHDRPASGVAHIDATVAVQGDPQRADPGGGDLRDRPLRRAELHGVDLPRLRARDDPSRGAPGDALRMVEATDEVVTSPCMARHANAENPGVGCRGRVPAPLGSIRRARRRQCRARPGGAGGPSGARGRRGIGAQRRAYAATDARAAMISRARRSAAAGGVSPERAASSRTSPTRSPMAHTARRSACSLHPDRSASM